MTAVCRLVHVCRVGVKAQDKNGDTPLRRACRYYDADVIGALLQLLSGADESIFNEWSDTSTGTTARCVDMRDEVKAILLSLYVDMLLVC